MRRIIAVILALMTLLTCAACASAAERSTPAASDLWDLLSETEEQTKERIFAEIQTKYLTADEKKYLTESESAENRALEAAIRNACEDGELEDLEDRIDEWSAFANNLRSVFSTYRSINQTPFRQTELAFLSSSKLEEYYDLQDSTEEAFADRDRDALKKLDSRWSSFCSSAKSDIKSGQDRMLQKWIDDANLASSLSGLLSLGTLRTDVSLSGHRITVCARYTVDPYYTSEEQLRSSLQYSVDLSASFYQNGVNALGAYISDVSLLVEYQSKSGKVLYSREFKVTKAATPSDLPSLRR